MVFTFGTEIALVSARIDCMAVRARAFRTRKGIGEKQ